MKIVLFGNATEKNAGIRYRVLRFAEMLAGEGHSCVLCLPSSVALWERLYNSGGRAGKLVYLLSVLARRAFQLRHVVGADVVFFRGPVFPYGPTVFERLIRLSGARMVFDIDDAVWEHPAYVQSAFLKFQDFEWIWKMGRMCAHGIVGNAYLEGQLLGRGIESTVVPTCIDPRIHIQKEYRGGGDGRPVVLGWTGLSNNLGHMDAIGDVLRRLAHERNIVLMVASDKDYRLGGVNVVNRRWKLADEVAYLQEPDIGLMPLVDSPRARGKCAFKALQFMGVGTPCVVSPVGMNAEIIEDGETGFLARTPEEWHDKLLRLIDDAVLRERMGRAARAAVLERFTHEVHFGTFKKALFGG